MAEINPPLGLQARSDHPALLLRRSISQQAREGICSFNGKDDLKVSQRGAGANMSVDVAKGAAYIQGDDVTDQGLYYCYNDGVVNKAIAAADATNPRIDLVVAEVDDNFHGQPGDTWTIKVITGTPAASPVPPNLPATGLLLAQVAVAANATSVVDANITTATDSLTTHATPVYIRPLAGPGLVRRQVFTASGTYRKTAGIRRIRVIVIGGGGGGGGAEGAAASLACGGGGGAGGYADELIAAADLAATETVTVGAGGTAGVGGAAPTSGGTGGTSSFGTTPFLSAVGGGGGGAQSASNATGRGAGAGAGGAGSGGDENMTGQGGGVGFRAGGASGFSGGGGASPLGGGGARSLTEGNAGENGAQPGGGGSGGCSNSATHRNGGVGGAGIVIVEEYV